MSLFWDASANATETVLRNHTTNSKFVRIALTPHAVRAIYAGNGFTKNCRKRWTVLRPVISGPQEPTDNCEEKAKNQIRRTVFISRGWDLAP